MGVPWDDFRRMPLAVWRAAVDGFVQSENEAVRRMAWQVSHQLVAAGCKADEVTVEKLLEKPRRKRRELTDEEKFEKLWVRTEKARAAGKLKE